MVRLSPVCVSFLAPTAKAGPVPLDIPAVITPVAARKHRRDNRVSGTLIHSAHVPKVASLWSTWGDMRVCTSQAHTLRVITHPLTGTCFWCKISRLRQYRTATALRVNIVEMPVVRRVAKPFCSSLLERYWSEAEHLSNELGFAV